MDVERIRGLREQAARLEDEAREISEELAQVEERRTELRARYESAVASLQRILGEMSTAVAGAMGPPIAGECPWCGGPLATDGARPAGEVCGRCRAEYGFERVDHLPELSERDADALPYGLIQVDRAGVIVGYNQAEEEAAGCRRERVLGRSFFRDVAPCTSVREFEGRFARMVEQGEPARAAFRYVFRFAGRERLVGISLRYAPERERGIIAVVPLDGPPTP